MPSRQAVEDLRSANAGIINLITGDLEGFWTSLDLSRPEATRDALLEVVPGLVDQYGEIAATVAADWYDEQRSEAGARGSYQAVTAPTTADEATEQTIRRTAAYLFTDTPLTMLSSLSEAIGKFAVQPGRSTIALNAGRERVRWARVPSGPSTCAFCLALASRGFVYASAERAGSRDRYHGKCDCVPTPSWDQNPEIEGYDPAALLAQYTDARNAAGSGALKDVLSTLREQDGIN